jgi:large subunit ribosomal protein MRP49
MAGIWGQGAQAFPPVQPLHLYSRGLTYPDRKFWRNFLPRLKYWNPAVPMIVNRVREQDTPATMTLYLREPGAPVKTDVPTPSSSFDGLSKAPPPAEGERVVTINMSNRRSESILQEFLEKTKAVPVQPTPQDELELREAEEREAQGAIDRERIRKQNEAEKREKRMIAQALSEAAAIKSEL